MRVVVGGVPRGRVVSGAALALSALVALVVSVPIGGVIDADTDGADAALGVGSTVAAGSTTGSTAGGNGLSTRHIENPNRMPSTPSAAMTIVRR